MENVKQTRLLLEAGEQNLRKVIFRDDKYVLLLENNGVEQVVDNPHLCELLEQAVKLLQWGDTLLNLKANDLINRVNDGYTPRSTPVGGRSKVIWDGGDRRLARVDYDKGYVLRMDIFGHGPNDNLVFAFSDLIDDPSAIELLEHAVKLIQYAQSIIEKKAKAVQPDKVPA